MKTLLKPLVRLLTGWGIFLHIYIYIYRKREIEREIDRLKGRERVRRDGVAREGEGRSLKFKKGLTNYVVY